MTRTEREAMAARWAEATPRDLDRELKDQVDRYLDLKARRAPDLSDAIDTLTVLLQVRAREKGPLLHRGHACSVDRYGDLWVTAVSPVRERMLRLKRTMDEAAAEAPTTKVEAVRPAAEVELARDDPAIRDLERRSAWRRKADAILEASGRVVASGRDLTSERIQAELTTVLTIRQIGDFIKGLRTRGEWPEGWTLRRTNRSTVIVDPPTEPEEGVQWVPLGWDLPGWEGTIDGRVRRSPDYVPPAGRTLKILPGQEVAPHPTHQNFALVRPGNVGPRTITRFGVGKRVALATGQPVPKHLDRRKDDGPAKRAVKHQAATA